MPSVFHATQWTIMHLLARAAILLSVGFTPAMLAGAEPLPHSVLILNQSGPGVPGYTAISTAFRSTLRASFNSPVAIYEENLDLTHFAGPQYGELLSAYVQKKYVGKPIGAIFAVGSAALEFALPLRTDHWSGIPIVFSAVSEDAASRFALLPDVTGTTIRLTLQNSVTAARALVPNLKRIALVGDPLERQTFRRHFKEEIPVLALDLEVIDLLGLPISEVRKRVAALPENAAIVYTALTSDGAGPIYIPDDALALIAEVANRPIVVDVENRIAFGGTGGFVVLPAPLGEAGARLVWRILNGERASDIPIAAGDFIKPVFAWRELQRWGIDEDRLPPGSEVRFRPVGMWEQYRVGILVASSVVMIQSMMITALLFERRRRRRAELESRQRLMEVAHMDRAASAGALSASFAHELNQPLGAILSNAEAAELVLEGDPPNVEMCKEILADIRRDDRRAADIIKHLRGLMKKASLELQEIDLNDAVRGVLKILASEANQQGVILSSHLLERALPVRADPVHLQQIILNLALNGMDAMAKCEPWRRLLSFQTAMIGDSEVEVSIADVGTGIPSEKLKSIFEKFFTTKSHGMGLGLSIARTIVETYGGRIWAENQAAGGAVIRFRLPLTRPLSA
jgi:signal transduction histidine kinase